MVIFIIFKYYFNINYILIIDNNIIEIKVEISDICFKFFKSVFTYLFQLTIENLHLAFERLLSLRRLFLIKHNKKTKRAFVSLPQRKTLFSYF